jgi:glycosyltransferase involved in cell wall biosynthesis
MTVAHGGTVCLLGAFPPPVHGMALVNAAVRDELARHGARVIILDIAAASLDRRLSRRVRRIRRVGTALLAYMRELAAGRGETLYVGLSAGWGQLYEGLFVALARARGARVFLHHHSFAYVERTTLPAWLLFHVAGRAACHVVLCEAMASRLRQRYPVMSAPTVISNAGLVVSPRARVRTELRCVGFLGNVSRAKGLLDVLEVARRLAPHGIRMRVAGPFEEENLREEVERAATELGTVEYLGPRYGDGKSEFFDSIDALLFPSFLSEAAPLVVLEALASGVPVVARNRGCVRSMVGRDAGLVLDPDCDFISAAADRILSWRDRPDELVAASESALQHSRELATDARARLNHLLAELAGSSVTLT